MSEAAPLETLVVAFADLYMQMMRTMDRRMAEHGASFARTKLLLCLMKRGAIRATDIAVYFNQSPRTVTEAIDALEREGLVARQPDPHDRRAKLIAITPKGAEAAAKTEPLRRQFIQQTFGQLDETEREAFTRILDKLSQTLPSE